MSTADRQTVDCTSYPNVITKDKIRKIQITAGALISDSTVIGAFSQCPPSFVPAPDASQIYGMVR